MDRFCSRDSFYGFSIRNDIREKPIESGHGGRRRFENGPAAWKMVEETFGPVD